MSDDLRKLIKDSAAEGAPSVNVNRLMERGRKRRWVRRSMAGASILLLALASWAVAGQLSNGSTGVTNVASGGAGYAISDVRIEDVHGDEADVSFAIAWRGDQFPGFRPCTVTVFDAEGTTIGEKTMNRVVSEEPEPNSLRIDVPVNGAPASAEVRCHERLDDPNGQYEISDVRVERPSLESSELLLYFDYRWVGSGMPGLAECHITISDDDQVVVEDDTTFRSESESGEMERSMFAPGDYKGEPSEATVECRPFE